MANVTLDMTVENAQELYDQLLVEKQRLLNQLDTVNYNLDAIGRAIRAETTQTAYAPSETDAGTWYRVTLASGTYSCKCKSYEFSQGLDYNGHCKHIRKVISEGRFE